MLRLVLKGKWYDMIDSGGKRIEFPAARYCLFIGERIKLEGGAK